MSQDKGWVILNYAFMKLIVSNVFWIMSPNIFPVLTRPTPYEVRYRSKNQYLAYVLHVL